MSKFAKLEGQETVVESVLCPVEEGWKIVLAKIANAIGFTGPLLMQRQKAVSNITNILSNPAVAKWIDQEVKFATKEMQDLCKREMEYYKKEFPIEAKQKGKVNLTATLYTSETELTRDLKSLDVAYITSETKNLRALKFKEKVGSFQQYVKCNNHLLFIIESADTLYRIALSFKVHGIVGDDEAEYIAVWTIDPPSDAELKKIIGDIH